MSNQISSHSIFTRRSIVVALLGLLGTGAILAQSVTTQTLMSYEAVKNVHLPSFGVGTSDGLDIIFPMFAQLDASDHQKIDEDAAKVLCNTLADLQVVCGQVGEDQEKHSTAGYHLLSKINYTTTKFGQASLAKIISNPTTDITILSTRQALIKELVENESLSGALTGICKKVKNLESTVLPFWDDQSDSVKKTYAQFYFDFWKFKDLNNNWLALEFGNRITPMLTLAAILGAEIVANGAYDIYEKWLATGQIGITESFCKGFRDAYDPTQLMSGASYTPTEEHKKRFESHLHRSQLVKISVYGGMKLVHLKGLVDGETMRTNQLKGLKQGLVGIKDLLKNLESMRDLLVKNPHVVRAMGGTDRLIALQNTLKKCEDLKASLATSTFANADVSMTTSVGRILVAYKRFDALKDELIDPLELLGQLDAYLSIAMVYKDHQQTPVRYCFVQYVQADTPTLKLRRLWNPLINKPLDKIGPNNLKLGAGFLGRNIILTGSNTGGKSTLLKGITINILLAQTIGLAAADKVELTPFAYIGTSLNIKDNIALGDSSFKAEVLRAKQLLETARDLSTGEFAFMVIDEPFKGTSPESAAAASYTFAHKMTGSNNTMYMLATHFAELNALEKDTDGICRNYKIDAARAVSRGDGATTIIHPYTLKPGVSLVNIADDMVASELNAITFGKNCSASAA